MSEPKRYAILGVVVEPSYNAQEVTSEMIAVRDGAWVRYEDYARLKAEVERMTERNDTLSMRYDSAWALINVQTSYIERLTIAGYAMAVKINVHGINDRFTDSQKLVDDWSNAAKGVQS